ncbi:hypothetical protein GCM10010967_18400 [Dyadobacter beijingensis]|uniref:LVIVD repeat-containing protein n=1 Tax=Dyadobacter beijingensis TaxID=365489 RepID=A0ABQ2HN21_9BACT|nr:hypothetical protein [Dyadobacter beijingensis]GGM86444.1 hypothetical protein GCM10010967_18400 [Dyadobacter beijingensis]
MKKIIPLLFLVLAAAGLMLILNACSDNMGDSGVNPQTGTGGSMARFAITGNTLYIVSKQSLEVYDIKDGGNPAKTISRNMGVGIETIFPYKQNLFIGAMDGMYIYNNATPANPILMSKFTHVMSCDPVVVQDKYAYVTLRAGVNCRPGGSFSSLDVVDISDPTRPALVNSQTVDSPFGLGVSGKKLFVCEGDKGFRVMDITDPAKPVHQRYYQDLPSYDVIVRGKHLIITGKKGLFQYSFDDSDSIRYLSQIPVL